MFTTMSKAELSRRENQIMEILYSKGPSTVVQITDHMPDELSRNAVRTFLTLLEGKRSVTRTKEGREFIYSPATEKSTAAQSALSKVLDVFFDGSLSDAVAARFSGSSPKISPAELARLEELIREARRKK
ncbi:MAG: putative transcriptional regulator [Akkermansiaceae bacterium]|jgi:predicted transcriptional regulator